ncbi:MAG: hypothetical protein WBK18_05480, partial [Thermacetogeniaceae bacterium]
IIERHYQQLDNDMLTEEEFEAVCRRYKEENDNAFGDDAPPLDNEIIYNSIKKCIAEKRERTSSEWMLRNAIDINEIYKLDAARALQCKTRLQKIPPFLSDQQVKAVNEMIKACDKRLDELEVEGLVEKFNAMSEDNKRNFLRKIADYIDSCGFKVC